MNSRSILLVAAACCGLTVCLLQRVHAAGQPETSQWMIEQERAWATMACGGKPVPNDVFADDFKGTAPNGSRYGKPAAQSNSDPNTKWSTDCRLDEVEVLFFGPDVAVAYGKESKTVALPDGKQERRCLVWTDSWLKRKGKWQIIAVQDSRIDCPEK